MYEGLSKWEKILFWILLIVLVVIVIIYLAWARGLVNISIIGQTTVNTTVPAY